MRGSAGEWLKARTILLLLVTVMRLMPGCDTRGYHQDEDDEDEEDNCHNHMHNHQDNYTSAEARLVMDLLRRYLPNKRLVRPLLNASHTVHIEFEIQLIQILDFDEKNQMLTTLVWKEYNWIDELLRWNPADYEGVDSIQLPNKKIWTPDIILYNNCPSAVKSLELARGLNFYDISHFLPTGGAGRTLMRYATPCGRKCDISSIGSSDVEQHKSLLVVNNFGRVLWMPPVKYHSSCSVDMTEYPFDVQTCELRFGSWAYDVTRLDITFMKGTDAMTLGEYVPNSEWKISNNSATKRVLHYPCCKHPFVDLVYKLDLARQVTFHMRLILVPTFLLSYMTLAIFWIPPFRPDRTAMGMSLFSSFLLLLIIVVESSPPTAAAKLSQYYIIVIFMVAMGIFLSLLTINISQCTRPFPDCLERVIVALRCCVRVEEERAGGHAAEYGLPSSRRKSRPLTNTEKWRIFAIILDRIYFFAFLIALLVSLVFVLPRRLFTWDST